MQDLKYDIRIRDIVIKDGDLDITDNPSCQNGGIIQYSSGAFNHNPTLGIGVLRVIGSGVDKVNFEMNRWQKQCLEDNAINATFKINAPNNSVTEVSIITNIAYQ